jgi:hypothetical protein
MIHDSRFTQEMAAFIHFVLRTSYLFRWALPIAGILRPFRAAIMSENI